jgi:hypothetical protein
MTGLTPGFPGYEEYYGKLHRDFDHLNREPNSDNFMNFILTANHLLDWIKKNTEIDPDLRRNVEEDWNKSTFGNEWECLRICKDLANASKHFDLTYGHRIIIRVSWPKQSWYGNSGIHSIEAYVEISDGKDVRTVMFMDLVRKIMEYWQYRLGSSTHANRMA